MSFHDARRSLLEETVAILFSLAAANLLVVFFVQGGYEFSVGPILIHARYVLKSLLLCLALALARAWLEGRRAGRSFSESLRSPLLLFLLTVLVYSLNGTTLWSGDTRPARYLPFTLVKEFNFDFDELSFLYELELPYFLVVSNGHVVSSYPPWAGVLALPVYLAPVLMGADPTSVPLIDDLEKRSAMLITAASVVVMLFVLRCVTSEKSAWLIAATYAFGTSSFSISSQALWQHGVVQLCLALTLYCIVKGLETARFSAYAGLALGCMVISRPLTLIVAIPFVAYIVHKQRDQLVGFIVAGSPPLLLFMAYNIFYFGSPFTTGFGGTMTPSEVVSARLSSSFDTPILEGIAGVLVSPAAGLLVYSPVFVLSALGLVIAWRDPRYLYLRYIGAAPLLLIIVVSKWHGWWGGDCYGPRLLADVTPILSLLLYPAVECCAGKTALRYSIIGLVTMSIGMHAIGAGRDRVTGAKTWSAFYEIGRHPERLWSWRNSPPMYYGKQLLVEESETLSLGGQ